MSERMTEEAVRVAIEEAGVAEPVFDQVHVAHVVRASHMYDILQHTSQERVTFGIMVSQALIEQGTCCLAWVTPYVDTKLTELLGAPRPSERVERAPETVTSKRPRIGPACWQAASCCAADAQSSTRPLGVDYTHFTTTVIATLPSLITLTLALMWVLYACPFIASPFFFFCSSCWFCCCCWCCYCCCSPSPLPR